VELFPNNNIYLSNYHLSTEKTDNMTVRPMDRIVYLKNLYFFTLSMATIITLHFISSIP
jgi:hypothetical protein